MVHQQLAADRRISSGKTFFYKKVFPFFWFGFLSLFILLIAATGLHDRNNQPAPLFVYFIPLFMAGFGYCLMRALIFDLADEVYDCGDYLIVKIGGAEDRVDLSNVVNVSYSTLTNPRRATVLLRVPCKFGKRFVFCPKRESLFDFRLFSNKIVDDLIERIDAARTKT